MKRINILLKRTTTTMIYGMIGEIKKGLRMNLQALSIGVPGVGITLALKWMDENLNANLCGIPIFPPNQSKVNPIGPVTCSLLVQPGRSIRRRVFKTGGSISGKCRISYPCRPQKACKQQCGLITRRVINDRWPASGPKHLQESASETRSGFALNQNRKRAKGCLA